MPDSNWIWQPDGLGIGTLVLTIVLGVLCIVVVSIRTLTKFRTGTFSLDDGLMIVALGVFTACCVFTCMAVYTGMGTMDTRLTGWNDLETTKVSESKSHRRREDLVINVLFADTSHIQNVVFFQITYAWSLPFIKSSVCLTMLRIITDKPLRIVIWVSMVASVASASE